MADILDEVEGDYRAEQLRLVVQRYAWVFGLALLIALAAAGLWQVWQARQASAATAAASQYLDATKAADAAASGNPAADAATAQRLIALADHAPPGYRALARLRAASLLADAGQLTQAQALWDRISTDPDAAPLLRQLASLLWVQRGLDRADPAALRTRLVSLTGTDNPYRLVALESLGLLDLRMRQTDAARAIFRRLADEPAAPAGVRGRAGAMLSRLGN